MAGDNPFGHMGEPRQEDDDFSTFYEQMFGATSGPTFTPRSDVIDEVDLAVKLSVAFRKGCSETHKPQLEQLVITQRDQVFKIKEPGLTEDYALACVYLDRLDKVLEAYESLEIENPKHQVAHGLLHFKEGNYAKAKDLLPHNSGVVEADLVLALIKYHEEPDSYSFFGDLQRLGETSSFANNLMGFLFFKNEDYSLAEGYFKKAIELDKNDTESHLNYMKALVAQGRVNDAYMHASTEFYPNTGSSLDPRQLDMVIKSKVEEPIFEVNNAMLYNMLKP